MNGSDVAHWLVILLPFAAVIRTLIFVILSIILFLERANTTLGRWITALFLATTAANAASAWFVWYIVRGIGDQRLLLDIHEWLIVTTMVIFPVITAIFGGFVTYYTIVDNHDRSKRNARQDLRELMQDQRDVDWEATQ
jgi:hypothetical protein